MKAVKKYKQTIENYLKYLIILEFNIAAPSFLLSHLQPKLPRKKSP